MPADYSGFEAGGYDEDAPKSIPIPIETHHLNKQIPINPIHDDNAHGNVFNKGQKNHDGKLVISVEHDEHAQTSYKRSKHCYAIESRPPIARVRRNL